MYDIHSERRIVMNILEITNLSKKYEKFTLDNISFELPQGYIMGFIGENGAGKTTTIKALLNIINKNNGSIKILGKDIESNELEIKKEIGYVSGESFYPKRKLKDITKVYSRFFEKWDNDIYQKYLEDFNLDPEKRMDELSKGMKMKYSIAIAMSHHAKLLILDEPTSGLDPVARDNLLEIFQGIVEAGDVSILYSTHITSDLEKCADYITFIKQGKLVESCSKDDLLDKYRLVNGNKESFEKMKNQLIAYKENAFGCIGLIPTEHAKNIDDVKYGQPSLDDIMIYYAEKEE